MLGHGGFCGTAVTPSGHKREVPGSQQLLALPTGSKHLLGLQTPPGEGKGQQISVRRAMGGSEHVSKGSDIFKEGFALLRLPAGLSKNPVSQCHSPDPHVSDNHCEPARLQRACGSYTET